MEIREIEYGVAYHYGNYIEVNKNLKKYPNLYKFIMEHEEKHLNVIGFTVKDILYDIEEAFKWNNLKMVSKIWWFMLKYPKSLFQLIPFGIKEKKLVIDINRIIIYGLYSLVIISLIIMWRVIWL